MIDPDNNNKEFNNWGSLTRKERNTVLLLMVVLILFIGILIGYRIGTATIINYYSNLSLCDLTNNITQWVAPTFDMG